MTERALKVAENFGRIGKRSAPALLKLSHQSVNLEGQHVR